MEHGDAAAMNVCEKAATRYNASDLCSCYRTMSTTTPPARMAGTAAESRDALESLDRPNELGVDGKGSVHHHSPYDERVVVVDEGGNIEETFDLSEKKLAGFIAHVDRTRGWDTLRYKETFGDILAEALTPTEGER